MLSTNDTAVTNKCRCANEVCPLGGNCAVNDIIYKATVTIPDLAYASENGKYYYGMTCQKFNDRLRSHRKSFNNAKYKGDSKLAEYIWTLKNRNINYDIKWERIRKTISYKPGMRYCALCTWEKYYILFGDKEKMINARSELMSKCIHKKAFLLENVDSSQKKKGEVTTQPTPQIRFLAPTLTPLRNNTIQRYALHSALSIDSHPIRLLAPTLTPLTDNTIQRYALHSTQSIDSQSTSSQRRNHNVPTQTVSHSTNENSNRETSVVNLRRSERTRKPKTIFDI